MSDNQQALYEVTLRDGYIYEKLSQPITPQIMKDATDAVVALQKEKSVDKLFVELPTGIGADMGIQFNAQALGEMWKLRAMKKVALLVPHQTIIGEVTSLINVSGMQNRFKVFDNQTDAVAWLENDLQP